MSALRGPGRRFAVRRVVPRADPRGAAGRYASRARTVNPAARAAGPWEESGGSGITPALLLSPATLHLSPAARRTLAGPPQCSRHPGSPIDRLRGPQRSPHDPRWSTGPQTRRVRRRVIVQSSEWGRLTLATERAAGLGFSFHPGSPRLNGSHRLCRDNSSRMLFQVSISRRAKDGSVARGTVALQDGGQRAPPRDAECVFHLRHLLPPRALQSPPSRSLPPALSRSVLTFSALRELRKSGLRG
ncbi:hypothetical protein AAFF_G00011830 [Aldrovandia affinis]|uniref:Uncharacterized protein n=1 Tax=Aldrovandia affinis TaxID=143900 RepID=A0AAD7S6J6_9TELE|nr:hypothetical protein AAFF_G00011830 [Aldrovandia affinis]